MADGSLEERNKVIDFLSVFMASEAALNQTGAFCNV